MRHVIIVAHFAKQLKPYLKKFRSLKQSLLQELIKFTPDQHDNLGRNIYKMRLRSTDLPKGKSESFRVLIYLTSVADYLVPLAIYLKSEQSTLSKKEINDHLETVLIEIETQNFI